MFIAKHLPVMSQEVIKSLAIREDGFYIDATFGRGGHSNLILQQLGPTGKLLVIDQDPEAIAVANGLYADNPQVTIAHAPFADLSKVVRDHAWPDPNLVGAASVAGVFFDLGVSSPQLDNAARGFSFMRQGPLDMRMNPDSGQSVAEYLQHVSAEDLANVLYKYGEERHSRRIARAIVNARNEAPITGTLQLADIIKQAHPAWTPKQHPATRSFQALRIFVNDELSQVETAMRVATDLLMPGGRLVVISFHSLEDRLVKSFIRQQQGAALPSGLPDPNSPPNPRLRKVSGLQKPTAEEVRINPRARSSRLRVAEKL